MEVVYLAREKERERLARVHFFKLRSPLIQVCNRFFDLAQQRRKSMTRVGGYDRVRGTSTGCRLTGWRQTTHVNGVTMITLSGHELSLCAFSSRGLLPRAEYRWGTTGGYLVNIESWFPSLSFFLSFFLRIVPSDISFLSSKNIEIEIINAWIRLISN